MIKSFVAGMVAGGVVTWIWGRDIRSFIDDRTRTVRTRTAEGLQGAAETLQAVAETVEEGLTGEASASQQRFEQIDSRVDSTPRAPSLGG
jgi:hypothetical protein